MTSTMMIVIAMKIIMVKIVMTITDIRIRFQLNHSMAQTNTTKTFLIQSKKKSSLFHMLVTKNKS